MSLTFAIIYFFNKEHFTLENIKNFRESIALFYSENKVLTTLLFFVGYMVITLFAIPIATIVVLLAGSVYGVFWGTLLISVASTFGACISMLISRKYFRKTIESKLSEKLKVIQKGFDEDGSYYLMSLRLTPFFPYVIINILFGLTSIKLKDFYIVSQIGIIINTFFYIYAGAKLNEINSFADILSFDLWFSLCVAGCLPILFRLCWKKFRKNKDQADQNSTP
jgi:uncharacterized membrane protein YdjX (TVP38/TMEM64 family)